MDSAPGCLPRPTAIILQRPLSTGARKEVCGFTRPTTITAVGIVGVAVHEDRHARPVVRPGAPATSSERMGQPMLSSVMPYSASTARWPSAVAPP